MIDKDCVKRKQKTGKSKPLDIKSLAIILLTIYSVSITCLYVWSSVHYKGLLTSLSEDIRQMNREVVRLPTEAHIKELEAQREEVLIEIRNIREARRDE